MTIDRGQTDVERRRPLNEDSIKLANRAVFRKAASSDDDTGMDTTVAAMLISPSTSQMTYDERRRQAGGRDLQRVGQELMAATNAQGGRDNICAILVRYSA